MARQLPATERRHLRALQIRNETGYDTRAIRKLVTRCLDELGLKTIGVVRVAYGRGASHAGTAAFGSVDRVPRMGFFHEAHLDERHVTRQGLNMVLTVPRDPAQFDLGLFARVILHEALHWKGVDHKDMTANQLWCRGKMPAWAVDVAVPFREKHVQTPEEKRAEKLAHARKMLERAEERQRHWAGVLLRATNAKVKWERRVRALERAPAPKVRELEFSQAVDEIGRRRARRVRGGRGGVGRRGELGRSGRGDVMLKVEVKKGQRVRVNIKHPDRWAFGSVAKLQGKTGKVERVKEYVPLEAARDETLKVLVEFDEPGEPWHSHQQPVTGFWFDATELEALP